MSPLIYTSPAQVVIAFYTLLNDKHYDAAFDCISPQLQEDVWQNDRAKFASGYFHTISIENIRFTPLEQDSKSASCELRYTDTMDALSHPLMDKLVDLPEQERNSENVLNNITRFKQLMLVNLKANSESIGKIPFERFFEKNNVEQCLYLGGADYIKNNSQLFPRKPLTMEIYRKIQCVNTETGWRINSFKRKPD